MEEPSSKRKIEAENIEKADNTDRISYIPDSMLCHILSFLPTKTCVRTSVLSHRWRNVWENMQVLEFCDKSEYLREAFESRRRSRFASFVNGVLARRRTRDIRKMRLLCNYTYKESFYADSVFTWVHAAIGPKLEELYLTIYPCYEESFVIPPSLFTCAKLVCISISGAINVYLPNYKHVQLPSLKTLLMKINFVDSMDALIAGCPNLETLDVSVYPKSESKIRVPHTLKKLNFVVKNRVKTCLEIDAPGLEYVRIVQCKVCVPSDTTNFPNIKTVYLDLYLDEEPEPVNPLLNFLRGISRVRMLESRPATTKQLLGSPAQGFPEFRNVVKLNLLLPCFNSRFLLNMLLKCPVLQVLVIQNEMMEQRLIQSVEEPMSVPHCLASSLSSIQIRKFQGFVDELEFVAYLLRRGLVLKKLIVEPALAVDFMKRYEIMQILCLLPRASNMCQLAFDQVVSLNSEVQHG